MSATWEEHVHGETVWVAVRARGAEWSWLTKQEAVAMALKWLDAYGDSAAATTADRPGSLRHDQVMPREQRLPTLMDRRPRRQGAATSSAARRGAAATAGRTFLPANGLPAAS